MLLLSCIFFFCAIYRNNVDKREALENLDLILLCLDEIVDGGYASVISYSLLFALRKSFDLFSKYFLPWRMILETNGPLIAEKVTSHSMDGAESPLSEQVMQHSFCFVSFTNVCLLFQFTLQKHIACHVDLRFLHLFPILNLLLRALNCCYVTHFR